LTIDFGHFGVNQPEDPWFQLDVGVLVHAILFALALVFFFFCTSPESIEPFEMPLNVRKCSRLTVVLVVGFFILWWQIPWIRVGKSREPRITETLVVACREADDMSWLNNRFPLENVAVSRSSKGREALAYLKYIVDNYDSLTDITIFIHNQDHAWHNSRLFNLRMSRNLEHLDREFVFKLGYFNLRCDWEPGCPARLNLSSTLDLGSGREQDMDHEVETMLQSWNQLHPFDPLPAVLAQPCCSQFVASRKSVRAVPLARWVHFQNWILNTELSDWSAGRVWEYTWQYLLAGHRTARWCPTEHDCFCYGHNICFGGKAGWRTWKKLEEEVELVGAAYMAVISGGGEDDGLKERLLALESKSEKLLAEAVERGKKDGKRHKSGQFRFDMTPPP
jgi:hypothetical protein